MRADRLLAALLVLQARGHVTAAQLGAELEVSERTARRDMEALMNAGVPVYAQRGRGGGWSLVGGARTDLTGLHAGEIRALFLAVAGRSASAPEHRSALRKLLRAIPEPLRPEAEAASRSLVVDDRDWSRTAVAAAEPHQAALERAVLAGVRVRLGYARPGREAEVRTVDPLGLAAKAGAWYLVAGTPRGLRSFRLSRVVSAEPTAEPVDRPAGFDLAVAWREMTAPLEERMTAASVRLRADAAALPLLQRLLGGRLRMDPAPPGAEATGAEATGAETTGLEATGPEATGPEATGLEAPGPEATGPGADDGYVRAEAVGPSVDVLVAQLAGFGDRVEILEPPEARRAMAALAARLAALYGPPA